MNVGINNGDFSFFANSGEEKINTCFSQVLAKHNPTNPKKTPKPKPKPEPKPEPEQPSKTKRKPRGPAKEIPPIDPEFKAIVEGLDEVHRFDWPSNKDFGNGLKHLCNQYIDNNVTNSQTHADKHITQYLKMKVFQMNTNEAIEEKYLPSDIDCVVKLILKEKVIKVPASDPNKLYRCGVLYDIVNKLNVFPEIDLHDLTTNSKNWFKAVPMYLSMQREIEEFNLLRAHQEPPKKRKKRKRRRPKGKKRQWIIKRKQMLDDLEYLPCIRNLVVVPMCDFRRTHFRIDCSSMYQILSSQKLIPKQLTEDGKPSDKNISQKVFNENKDYIWNQYFYMRKIRWFVRRKKKFDFSINSDGIAVSLQYSTKKKKTSNTQSGTSRLDIIDMLKAGRFKRLGGTDSGMRNWNTTTIHEIDTCKEINFVKKSKQFHWETHQNVRNAKAKRFTKNFIEKERQDRENRELYAIMPSPKGSQWLSYIKHRVKMTKHGIEAYSTAKYTRLALDKYIGSNKVIDGFVNKITNKEPTLLFHGADGEVPPDCPIRIKKHVRCPGVRKLMQAYKKRPYIVVVPVDEWGTSQTDARCMCRFQNQPKSAKFKMCRCIPNAITLLPTKIVSKFGKTDTSTYRQLQRTLNGAFEIEEELMSRVKPYYKKWQLDLECTVTWHRDVVAAKNILLKGLWTLLGLPIPAAINRYWNQINADAAVFDDDNDVDISEPEFE
ncbi:uncharacterized protein LOC116345175 isoform X2 [Contarinia nasturtii]|uniref:uncharacterized protein LOC116345175 isoform X2 n=1 Tax=Contarinia nasturtii TaxID=265458 RepID=UPI0012D38A76|nr:uncharacterized protein LOC116345175 isoform X2 [Contarinia nasturtii]